MYDRHETTVRIVTDKSLTKGMREALHRAIARVLDDPMEDFKPGVDRVVNITVSQSQQVLSDE